jgi:hypothetical protein
MESDNFSASLGSLRHIVTISSEVSQRATRLQKHEMPMSATKATEKIVSQIELVRE